MLKFKKYINVNTKVLLVLFAYPLILAFFLEVFVQEISFSTFSNLGENVLFSIIIFLVINQIVCFKYGKQLAHILIIFFYLILFLESGLYLLFQTRFNASYIYVILNTNFNEIKEFGTVYYKNNLIWLLLFFIPLLKIFQKDIYEKEKPKNKTLLASGSFVLLILLVLKFSTLIVWNLPFISIKSYFQYKEQINSFEEFNNKTKDVTTDLVLDNETIVVVIGESTTSKHMRIYGYPRETTPRLSQLSDSLFIYNNVISPHVYTTASIFDIFTLANYENATPSYGLIDYIKSSGFKVFWLSNQRPVGFHDNIVSRLASAADESIFLSYNDYRHSTLYDEVLLPKLEEKLLVNGKKVIFLHVIGTHYDYKNRYPNKFDKFKTGIGNSSVQKIINSYDNAILYNDFIVSEIIELVRKKTKKSAVIYFSDHGEEVYDDEEFFGHFQDKPTVAMYEVPFLMYLSSDYEKPKDFEVKTKRPYMLDDFPHSLTHLMGIESELLEKERSVFSSSFTHRKRLVQDSIDYDLLFKAKDFIND